MRGAPIFPGLLVAAAALFLPGALMPGQDGSAISDKCPRNPVRTFPVGSVTDVDDGRPPCRIEFHETGIRLEAVADGSHPDPGRTVVVDSNGRYITGNAPGWPGTISIWDSRGRFLSSFGRAGEGPGEFTLRGSLNLFVDRRDNVHVMDGGFRWSVFSPGHDFIRSTSSRALIGFWMSTAVLDDGTVLSSESALDPTRYFRVVDTAGAVVRTFADAQGAGQDWDMRPVSYAGGESFWAAPPIVGGNAYVLEEWSTDGELLRTIRREAPWFRTTVQGQLSPAVSQLHMTNDGLLYVMVRRPTPEYRSESERAGRRGEYVARETLERLIEVLFEVIDTRSGELLASDRHLAAEARELAPRRLFRGLLTGYRYREDADVLPYVEIVRVELVPR